MENLYVLEFTHPAPEVIRVKYKHVKCGQCGTRPAARVGGVGVLFAKKSQLVDFGCTAQGIIIHQSVVDHLTEARISGWRPGCLQVENVSKLRDQDVAYCEMIVIGHTREFAKHTGLAIEKECKECGFQRFARPHEGLEIPKECLDGSDVFVIEELPGIDVATDAFRRVVDEHQHTGVRFIPIAEWRSDPLI